MASPEEILDIIRKTAAGDNVMVIAHMPGIGSLARALRVDPAPAHTAFDKYPTGGTTVLELQGDWAALDFGTTHLDTYITPADLG